MSDKKLRCFVAMAFGQEDTDKIFGNFVTKFKDGLTIRRVDRINHNNDIDDQIVAEIKAADFVLADLTYARQSVYFEAGYAQGRPIPVIYSARHDHIGKMATNDARRVHFDLQMRNIIEWKSPNDHNFYRRLKARIASISVPLLRDRWEAEEREKDAVNLRICHSMSN